MHSFKPMVFAVSFCLCMGVSVDGKADVFLKSSVFRETPSYNVHLIDSEDKSLEEAKAFVTQMSEDGISFLENEELTHDERTAEFRKLLKKNFDLKTIGRFTLGRYWNEANDAQKEEFHKLFDENIIETYSNRFSEYQGQDLQVDSARPEGKSDVLVTSYLVGNERPKIQVDWRVRHKNGHFRVVDVIVEGVSMAVTQRSDFAAVIQRGGGDIEVLLEHLRS